MSQISDLRNYVNANIVNNGTRNITATQMNIILNTILDVAEALTNGGGALQIKSGYTIIAGVTPGFPAGVSSWQSNDWKGWEVVLCQAGYGPLNKGVFYSYTKNDGLITLLLPSAKFSQDAEYYILFEPKTI